MIMSQVGVAYQPYQTYDKRCFQPTDRFYIRASVFLPNGDVDPVSGMLKQNAKRRGRTQAMRMEAHRLDREYAQMDQAVQKRVNEKGVRIPLRTGVLLACALALVFALILFMQQGVIAQRMKTVASINQQIENVRAANAELQAQIDEASDSATICYAAARDLDMVPASSTQAIHLTAVDTRPTVAEAQISASAGSQTTVETAAAAGR
jgi:hypothetical protein